MVTMETWPWVRSRTSLAKNSSPSPGSEVAGYSLASVHSSPWSCAKAGAAAARRAARKRRTRFMASFCLTGGNPMRTLKVLTAGLFAAIATSAAAQTKWDMPTPYPATNFHTENVMQFASDVEKATGGKLKITVHANASLFKAPEIKRAVQGNQAQIGEILLSGYS